MGALHALPEARAGSEGSVGCLRRLSGAGREGERRTSQEQENTCDMGFPVMNRPHGVTQLLAHLPPSITEQYVLIAETDHVFMPELGLTRRPQGRRSAPARYVYQLSSLEDVHCTYAIHVATPSLPYELHTAYTQVRTEEPCDAQEAHVLPLRVHGRAGRGVAARCRALRR